MSTGDGAPTPPDQPSAPSLAAQEVRGRAFSGVVQFALRGVALRGIGFVGTLVVAAQLGPSGLGVVAFGLTFQVIGRFLTDAGLGASLLRRPEIPDRAALQRLFGFQLLTASVFLGVLAAIAIPLGETGRIATAMASSVLVGSLSTPGSVRCQHQLQFRPIVWSDLTATLVFWIGSIVGVLAGFGVWALGVAAPVSSLLAGLVMVRLSGVGLLRPRLDLGWARTLLRFGVAFQGAQLMNLTREQGINLLTAAIGGTAVLGVWTLAWRLLQTVYLIFQAVWRVTFPAMSRLLETGEDPAPVVGRMLSRMTIVTAVVLVGVVAPAPVMLPLLFGREWIPTADILGPAGLSVLIVGPVSTAVIGYLYSRGEAGVGVRALAADTAVTFLVAFPVLREFGPVTIGLGVLAGTVVHVLVLATAMRPHMDLPWLRAYLVPVLAAVVAGAPVYLAVDSFDRTLVTAISALLLAEGLLAFLLILVARPAVRDTVHLVARLRRTRTPGAAT